LRWFVVSPLVCLLAIGCQSIVPTPNSNESALFERIKGKISISSQASSLSFDWTQEDGLHRLRFSSFGLWVADFVTLGNELSIRTADGEKWDQAAAELWMQSNLGINLPFKSVAFWISGRPDPAHPSIRGDEAFTQLGWQVKINRLHKQGYPQKLTVENAGIKVKIAVSSWQ
jgi:outer membrane biogenesis lipoprotein LolB